MTLASRTKISRAVKRALAITSQPVGSIDDSAELAADLGVDSLTLASLLVSVEEQLGMQLPAGAESYLAGVRTVGELVNGLAMALAQDDEP